jgi:hypothetical protein
MNVLEKVSRISICHEFMMVLHEHDQNINILKRQLLLLFFFFFFVKGARKYSYILHCIYG